MAAIIERPLKLFISYAHEDETLLKELVKHLSQLQRDGLIENWHDREITAGAEWAGKIDEHLEAADIVLLLVSADFLSSRYCYDVEMKRALERHDSGKARVIPIILRPADWETSPFAKLQALPKNGKPVVEWRRRDRAFLDVAKGLRRVVQELRGHAAVTSQGVRGAAQRVRELGVRPIVMAVSLAALAIVSGWWGWRGYQRNLEVRRYVSQGEDFLNVGRYADARPPFERALTLNRENQQARRGLKKVELAKLLPDAVAFQQQLQQLLSEMPRDAHLKMLEGDQLYGAGQIEDATRRYQEAANLKPDLAEAHFRLGVLYEQKRELKPALEKYLRAVELSRSSPHYRNNLANLYFKRGEYKEAVEEYREVVRLAQFPLAALECATIQRLLGELEEAREQQQTAIEWLEQDAVAKLPENALPWSFEISDRKEVRIYAPAEKLCYARLTLSATEYLAANEPGASEQAGRAAQACGARSLNVKSIVRSELERLAEERRELAVRAVDYARQYLVRP
jgi:tetratricopeptide (TPR) repeat protein